MPAPEVPADSVPTSVVEESRRAVAELGAADTLLARGVMDPAAARRCPPARNSRGASQMRELADPPKHIRVQAANPAQAT